MSTNARMSPPASWAVCVASAFALIAAIAAPCAATGSALPAEEDAQLLDHELVVLELGQARDRGGADDAGAAHADRERAAVGGVAVGVQPALLLERAARLPRGLADAVGGLLVAVHDVRLAQQPCVVVGCAAGQRGMEDRAAVAAQLDRDGQPARGGRVAQLHAERPGDVVVEAVELQALLLLRELLERGHASIVAVRRWLALEG